MPVKRAYFVSMLVAASGFGCLDASRGNLAYKDTSPPSVLSTIPAPNATLARTSPISITFSEAMDLRTLGAGIQLAKAGTAVPLVLGIPSPEELPQTADNVDQPYAVSARPVAGSFEPSVGSALDYLLTLTTLLTDEAGNALPTPLQIRFTVM